MIAAVNFWLMDSKVKAVLARMEAEKRVHGRENWNVPRPTAEFLGFMVRASGARKVLEIGTSNGYSGMFIAEALSHSKGLLYTVESNKGRYDEAAGNFGEAGVGLYVRQILGHAPEVFGEGVTGGDPVLSVERAFDMVFMDATKNEYPAHLKAALPRVRKGGVIVADNCLSHPAELGEFFGLVEGRKDLRSVLLPFDNGVMVILNGGD
jgi:predicted O-methyltransferase YrrM